MVELGANANWHFGVPIGAPNFVLIPRAFPKYFLYFLNFLKNIFSV